MHLSTSRDDKQCALDRQKPFVVYTMTGDEAGQRLVYNCDSPNNGGKVTGLWEFKPGTGEGKCLFEKQWRMMDPIMTRVDDRVYFSLFHEDYCIYDLSAGRGEIFFSTVDQKSKNFFKVKFRPAQGIAYYGPFMVRENQIWFGGDCSLKLIMLPDGAASPPIVMLMDNLLLNNTRLLFPHPDGVSAIAVDSQQINVIKPKNGGETP